MPSSYLTELALRSAVNSTSRIVSTGSGSEENPADTIKNVALRRSQEMIQGTSDATTASTQIITQSQAIHYATQGLKLAYAAICKQLAVLNDQRLSFDKERQAGIATFLVPTNKEESDLSKEEKAIKGFIELVSRNPLFLTYLGIHSGEHLTDHGYKFYSVLPFYRMSEALGQPVSSSKPLDRQRIAINLFFKSALPEAISDIEIAFQTDWKFVAFFTSAFQRKNYLNDRRAPRFIMMSLSNLLWNLQHPVDPVTGFPLSLNRCIAICRDVELLLNQLLNPDSPPYLHTISNDDNGLVSFLRKLEIHTKALRAAYAEEQLHEINIGDITNSTRQALRIMDQCVFKLIYKFHNPITNKDEPDEKAAEKIAYTISYLNQLLIRNPSLLAAFKSFPAWIPAESLMNVPPTTVIDALIIFCHLSWRERNRLIDTIKRSAIPSALEFAHTLTEFDKKFVNPIREVSKKELNTNIFTPKHAEVSCLTARRLIPLLTLVIKDYRVDVDTPTTSEYRKPVTDSTSSIRSGKQQVQSIILSAEKGGEYYNWALSSFVTMASDVAAEIEEMPKRQYRLTQISELLDNVAELVETYRCFLQNREFQDFLRKCLNKVKEECTSLDEHIERVDKHLSLDERMDRSLRAIIRPMTKDLNSCLDTFAVATANLERVISAPDFTDQQRQLLALKLRNISEQFSVLFAQDSGISSLAGLPLLIAASETTSRISPPIAVKNDFVESRRVIALRNLVQRCYNALSFQSKQGHKGMLLNELLTMINSKPNFTDRQVRHVVMELTRVTASYRESWLFKAPYGQTRSAHALIAAIKDPNLNNVLPLASIIFNQSVNIAQMSEAQILKRLRSLREGNFWQESSSNMRLVPFSS